MSIVKLVVRITASFASIVSNTPTTTPGTLTMMASCSITHAIAVFEGHRMLFATQVYERVNPNSLAEVTKQLQWSELKVYDINAPGENHGLLLGTHGWNYDPSRTVD